MKGGAWRLLTESYGEKDVLANHSQGQPYSDTKPTYIMLLKMANTFPSLALNSRSYIS